MGRRRTTNRKGRLTRGLADDCNDVLTVILGNLEMLKARLTGKEERLLLGEIEKAAKLGAQLTQRLLAFACSLPFDAGFADEAQPMQPTGWGVSRQSQFKR